MRAKEGGGAGVSPITLTYDEVLALPSAEVTATLDCTSGWYSTQTWHGFPLRAVAPSRRGWHWVKWLTEMDVPGNA